MKCISKLLTEIPSENVAKVWTLSAQDINDDDVVCTLIPLLEPRVESSNRLLMQQLSIKLGYN